ncbi:Uncharacterized protein conserved in bacteria [Mycobacteroides abscessus subsp. massiliense]|nr:Uncharacterized protein conserved in bacteria [Mycobacteroides abscessus subsp. massiliense]
MWQQAGQPITLLLAGTQIIASLKNSGLVPQNALLEGGDVYQSEHITLIKIPFVAQQDFDKLLNLADGAVIRGEDSFVRAQLAGKPFFTSKRMAPKRGKMAGRTFYPKKCRRKTCRLYFKAQKNTLK